VLSVRLGLDPDAGPRVVEELLNTTPVPA
jgi:hypothetical protein